MRPGTRVPCDPKIREFMRYYMPTTRGKCQLQAHIVIGIGQERPPRKCLRYFTELVAWAKNWTSSSAAARG
jgi:hypothetical protein